MKYIYLIASFNALFFTVLLLQKRPKALHDKILIFWLGYLCLFTASYAFSSSAWFANNQLLQAGLIAWFLLHGPFLYCYIKALVSKNSSLHIRDLLHLMPFVLLMIYLFTASLFPEYAARIRMDHVHHALQPPVLFQLFLVLTAISGPAYFTWSVRSFIKLDQKIYNNFSFSDDLTLGWLRKLVYIFGAIWTALIVIAAIHHVFHLFSMVFCMDGLFLSLSVFIILIGYFGLRQQEIFMHFSGEQNEIVEVVKTKYAGMSLGEEDMMLYVDKINQFMKAEKPYLDMGLTLSQLAEKLQIPSHHLSRVINEKFGLNFFDFINHYRVDEVKIKMADPEFNNLSLLGIAFECGFNTKSAFNRAFKKMTGLTPSEFKKTPA